MKKLWASVIKEFLLLVRDLPGLLLLYIMPLTFVIVIALIQDTTFNSLKDSTVRLLLVNDDKDSLGKEIELGLQSSGFFEIERYYNGSRPDFNKLKEIVLSGDYQIGIYIEPNSTESIRKNIKKLVKQSINADKKLNPQQMPDSVRIKIIMDPAIKSSFRSAVLSSINSFVSKIESKIVFKSFRDELASYIPFNLPDMQEDQKSMLNIQEIYPTNSKNDELPNSVQHNVPAWTLFAIFFIVIPFTGNIIKEREHGSGIRLQTLPFTYITVISAKLIVYLIVCLLQFAMMFSAGAFLMPVLGLPALDLNVSYPALLSLVIASALAASGFSIAIGTIAKTSEQAAIFGSVSVMLLAAIGGIWVPVYVMPDYMKDLSQISPMNWALEGFYGVFLRKSSVAAVLLKDLYLICFFLACSGLSYLYNWKFRSY